MFVPSAPLAPSGEGASSYAARAGHQVRQRLDFVNWSGLGESQLLVGATFRLVDQPVAGNRALHQPNEAFTLCSSTIETTFTGRPSRWSGTGSPRPTWFGASAVGLWRVRWSSPQCVGVGPGLDPNLCRVQRPPRILLPGLVHQPYCTLSNSCGYFLGAGMVTILSGNQTVHQTRGGSQARTHGGTHIKSEVITKSEAFIWPGRAPGGGHSHALRPAEPTLKLWRLVTIRAVAGLRN